MIERDFTIINDRGLHMRPSQMIVDAVKHREVNVIIRARDRNISTRSLLHIMAAGIRTGETITVICEGPEEAEVMDRIAELIEYEFSNLNTEG